MRSIQLTFTGCLLTAGLAFGTVVNFDITNTESIGPTGSSLPGVIGNQTAAEWNPISSRAYYTDQIDETGLPTSASFQLADGSATFSRADATSGNFYNTYATAGNSTGPVTNTFTIGGIVSSTADVYCYATWKWIDAGSAFRFSADDGTTWTDWHYADGTPSEATAPLDEGSSYIKFEDTAVSDAGELIGQWVAYTNEVSLAYRGIFNAVQVDAEFGIPSPPQFTTNNIVLGDFYVGYPVSESLTPYTESTSLTFSNLTENTWFTLDADGTLSGTPSGDDIGPSTIAVSITDPHGQTGTANLELNVTLPTMCYIDDFENVDGFGDIEINSRGEGGGLVYDPIDDTNFLDIDEVSGSISFNTSSSGNVGAERSAIHSANNFSVINGFTLIVEYSIKTVETTVSDTATFGLVDDTSNLSGVFLSAQASNGLGVSLTTRSSTIPGLNQCTYADGATAGTFTSVDTNQVSAIGNNQTCTITIDPEGNYSYSIAQSGETAVPTTGSVPDFDLTKLYYFASFCQRSSTGFSIQSISLISIPSVTEVKEFSATKSDNSTLTFRWYGEIGGSYTLQRCGNLTVAENWDDVSTHEGLGAEIVLPLDLGEADAQAFYRIKLNP